jgi:hypothetical protein
MHSTEETEKNHENASLKIGGTLVVSSVTTAPTFSPSQIISNS